MTDSLTILVTRPSGPAQKTAAALQEKGFSPFIVPLTETISLPLDADPAGFNALIATSVAAFFHAPEMRKEKWRRYPLYCVGSTTAAMARKDGFTVAAIAPTARKLIDLIKNEDKHFLYLAGRFRRPDLEKALSHKHFDVIEVYDTIKCAVDEKEIKNLPARFDIVLFYSALAAENIKPLCHLFDENSIALCLSERIAQSLSADDFKGKRLIVDQPDETAMMEALVSCPIIIAK